MLAEDRAEKYSSRPFPGKALFTSAPGASALAAAARAGVAQWQSTCFVNRWLGVQVPSSARRSPFTQPNESGGLPEWPKGADCKSAGYAFDGSNPSPSTAGVIAGVAQLVERQPSKLNVAGSNPVARSPVPAHLAQSVEHFLGKEEVTGSIPVVGFEWLWHLFR